MALKESTWEIHCDGYYPYCKICGYDPSFSELKKTNYIPPQICPNCGAYMTNVDKFKNIFEDA